MREDGDKNRGGLVEVVLRSSMILRIIVRWNKLRGYDLPSSHWRRVRDFGLARVQHNSTDGVCILTLVYQTMLAEFIVRKKGRNATSTLPRHFFQNLETM